ncbi:hypothetical protein D917_01743 [Trichinella nativa]|uniref:Uncharacterized protein n=1 Tax=Trichinella nativa TaxID=6335 RepID=A0A1Y3EQ55_9BILA|nr:hypothetical protein D917_01743 [Trichinella nativa]
MTDPLLSKVLKCIKMASVISGRNTLPSSVAVTIIWHWRKFSTSLPEKNSCHDGYNDEKPRLLADHLCVSAKCAAHCVVDEVEVQQTLRANKQLAAISMPSDRLAVRRKSATL